MRASESLEDGMLTKGRRSEMLWVIHSEEVSPLYEYLPLEKKETVYTPNGDFLSSAIRTIFALDADTRTTMGNARHELVPFTQAT